MKYNEIVKNIGQPILIEMRDANVTREFQNIDFIKRNANLTTNWSVGFLIELSKDFVKFGSEHINGEWTYPVVWPRNNVGKIYELSPSTETKKPAKIPDKLPEIVYERWGDGQAAKGKVSKKVVIDKNIIKQVDAIGFLLDVNKERIVIAEELSLEDNKARTTSAIYPEYADNMLYLSPSKEIATNQEPKESET